jgi:GNAT superfamily N-acetyltransferase
VSFRGPELLGSDHVVQGFDCGRAELSDWLVRRALPNQRSGASRTWVVIDEAVGRVVAYYASATASIIRSAATRRAGRNQPDDIPAILLARLAVDRGYAGRGLGVALLKHFVLKALEVSAIVGARVLLVHAKDDEARQFYLRHDFEPSPIDELTLMRVISDIA